MLTRLFAVALAALGAAPALALDARDDHGAAMVGQDSRAREPRQFWAGTKPVVWSLRSGSYSGRQPVAPLGLSVRQEIAGTKPVVWSLRTGTKRASQPVPEPLTSMDRCRATKPVVCSLRGGRY